MKNNDFKKYPIVEVFSFPENTLTIAVRTEDDKYPLMIGEAAIFLGKVKKAIVKIRGERMSNSGSIRIIEISNDCDFEESEVKKLSYEIQEQ